MDEYIHKVEALDDDLRSKGVKIHARPVVGALCWC